MQLRVQSGSTFSYTDVEIADGELVQSKRLSADGGREQLENGDVEIAVYGDFLGHNTLDDYLDDLTGGFSHLRAQLKDERFGITIEGSIYEGDLSYDEVNDKWIVLLLGDAEEEARSRLREIGDLEQALRDHIADTTLSELQAPHSVTKVWTAGAPTSEGTEPLWRGTVRHRADKSGTPGRDNAVLDEWAGWQKLGEYRAYDPAVLLGQVFPSSVEPHPDETSAHTTTPTTGEVPQIPQETETYVADDGTETTVDLPPVRIFSVTDWSEPTPKSFPHYRGVPNWTAEELLDYYLDKSGRRLIATYEAFPSDTIRLVFSDDTTDLNASSSLDSTVGTDGLATGDRREQDFYEADMKRPRLPDLAVQNGPIHEQSIHPPNPGKPEQLDRAQGKMNHDSGESPTDWYSPVQSQAPLNYEKVWRLKRSGSERHVAYNIPGARFEDLYSALPAPPKAKYAAERWGAGRNTRVVNENESSIRIDARPAQILHICDSDLHQRGRTGENLDLFTLFDNEDRRHFLDTRYDPWRDPTLSPDMTKRELPGNYSRIHHNARRGWDREEIDTGDLHRYNIESFNQFFRDNDLSQGLYGRWAYLSVRQRGGDHGGYVVLRLTDGDGNFYGSYQSGGEYKASTNESLDDIALGWANAIVDSSANSLTFSEVSTPGSSVLIEGVNPSALTFTEQRLPGPTRKSQIDVDVTRDSSNNEIEFDIEGVSNKPSDWEICLEYGWPVVEYESDDVYEAAIGGERTDSYPSFGEPNALLWADFRKPGTTDVPYDRRMPSEVVFDQTPTNEEEAVQYLNTEGIAKANNSIGVHGLANSCWAYTTWKRKEASQSERIEVQVEADVSGLEFQVGDPNRGLEWRGYSWLVQEIEQQADRPIATLTLERYSPTDLQVSNLYTQTNQPSIAPPRNATLQKVLVHELRKAKDLNDDGTDQDGDLFTIEGSLGDDLNILQWEPPQHQDQAGIWYYEVQGIAPNFAAGRTGNEPYWRVHVTTGTTFYQKTVNNFREYKNTYRVRAVSFPDETGDVVTSDFAYPEKLSTTVHRTQNLTPTDYYQ